MKLIFITVNAGKLQEARHWLLPILPEGSQVEGKVMSLAEPQTLDLNYLIEKKAEQAAQRIKFPFLVDDTALCFKAWQGLPGTFVKFFVDKIGTQGLFDALAAFPNREATAICSLGYRDAQQTHYFQAELHGRIVPPRGGGGFGWDALFQPEGSQQTLAEMDQSTRRQFSMRARAFEQLARHISLSSQFNNPPPPCS